MAKARVVVLASGAGSTFASLVADARVGRLKAEIVGLIVSRAECGAIEKAKTLNVPCVALQSQEEGVRDTELMDRLNEFHADWVVLAGYTRRLGPRILASFHGRIVNIHPSLLPKYGGQGMFGMAIHRAVLRAGEKKTGVTVHLVDEHYDCGRIMAQIEVQVSPGDSPEALSERVKMVEKDFYPKILNLLVHSSVRPAF